MRMNKNTKIITGSVVALAVIVVLGIVYAAFTQQLTINGTATGRSSSWRIYFSRLTGPTLNGTAKEITSPSIDNNTATSIGDYSVTVTSPGDYIEYEFDVTNSGDYDASLTGLTMNSASSLTYVGSGDNKTNDENNVKSQIEYTLKYTDGTSVAQYDTLKSKETKTMRLRLTYKTFDNHELLPQADVAISGLGISLTYTQDGNAKVNNDGTTPYDPYPVGKQITVANETYHIISVPAGQDYVVALKDTPLTVNEVNTYGVGHINQYTYDSQGTAYNSGGYGGMAYYTSETCGDPNGSYVDTGCTTSYNQSEVKYAVDAWAAAKFTDELKEVNGYSARLIKFDEAHSFGYGNEPQSPCGPACGVLYYPRTDSVPDWLWGSNYFYWTMSPKDGSSSFVWYVSSDGDLEGSDVDIDSSGAVRPVINVYKSSISS